MFCSLVGSSASKAVPSPHRPGQQLEAMVFSSITISSRYLQRLALATDIALASYLNTVMTGEFDRVLFVCDRSLYGSWLEGSTWEQKAQCRGHLGCVVEHNLGVCEVLPGRQPAHCSAFSVCFKKIIIWGMAAYIFNPCTQEADQEGLLV